MEANIAVAAADGDEMRKMVIQDDRAIYYDTKKSKLITRMFDIDHDLSNPGEVFCYYAKFLYRTERGNWFFYESEHFPIDCEDFDNSRSIRPCHEFEALRFMVEAGRLDLAKKYGLKEEEA